MERDDQVRRLTADVELLQAQVAGMSAAVTAFGEDIQRLTTLMLSIADHVGVLAGRLAEEGNRG